MTAPAFVHLRLHSEYSVSDGLVQPELALERAKALGMPALALTDAGNLFGLIKFYRAAAARGIKPIAGCDLWLSQPNERDRPARMLLLCQSRVGYLRLCELITRAYRENQGRGRPELRREWLDGDGGQGLIALCGARHGEIGAALAAGNDGLAEALATEWATRMPRRFYLEVQRAGHPEDEVHLRACAPLAARLGVPLVATHPVQFLDADDFRAHEARVCIAEGYSLGDPRRPRRYTAEQYLLSAEQMVARFADLPSALANSVEIAKRCNLELVLGTTHLPRFPTPDGVTLDAFMQREAERGLDVRLAALYPHPDERARAAPRYRERLAFEIETIVKMGFPGYFLIVADFINWAKRSQVPVGPGRGSGAGSLVAYSLGITDLDPLRYNLLFERFLNPERVSMPDFDIDFCQEGRDRVIGYVREKYGTESVAQIVTFGTMAARAVVRDAGRVLDLPFSFCDQIAKLVPFQPGKVVTLRRRSGDAQPNVIYAREVEPQIEAREKAEEEVAELLALGERLEGVVRNVGMHAGGVLIAPGKLTEFCPLYVAEGTDAAVSQFDKDDVEAVGLVKFDFLGLTTLTILDWTLKFIARLDPHASIRLDALPLDDVQTYRLFARANTTAVFQFESRGMRDLLKLARPDRFEDIIALVALYRPGPMDLIPEFCDRKHGRHAVAYPDPRVEQVLAETYGIMVYQEQVMQMAQLVGGYSLGGADLLRRAMGKKKLEEMAEQRQIFADGAARSGISAPKANEMFDLMEKFAGYGFNKSHAAAYALVAYQTAWFKVHHAAAFFAANLSAVMDDADKVRALCQDARENGLVVLAPDVNSGEYRFVPIDTQSIRFGLGAVKGTGEAAIDAIAAERARSGAFRDLFDLCARVDKRMVNRRVVEALVRAGAFDALDDNRARQLSWVGLALASAEQRERNAQQVSLFGGSETEARPPVRLPDPPAWDRREQLREEKAALGFYYSGHPYSAYRDELGAFVRTTLERLAPIANGYEYGGGAQATQSIAGVVESVRQLKTQNSARLIVITLSDGTAAVEVTMYGELYDLHRKTIVEDALLVMEVKVRDIRRAGSGGAGGQVPGDEASVDTFRRIAAEKVYDLAAARNRFARGLRLRCNGGSHSAKLREVLGPYRNGPCPVQILYDNSYAQAKLTLGESWNVNLHDELVGKLGAWLQPGAVEIVY
ncbi:MAG: DNA polymerase III subunit alpha [Proteobacteria bacterium]|nr:DNA polymerase III subunit alpha [Burkholderiales bacterium]